MNRNTFFLMFMFFFLLMLPVFSFGAQAEIEPVESLLSAFIQESYPDCQLFDYAPIGQEKTEYIALALDSEEKPAVMIVNTEQPAAGVEFHNEKILKEIPLDKGTVQVMDHMPNGMGFDFLGYGRWILAKGIGNTGISHFVVQRILDDFTVLSSQVLILFHSQSLLKTEMQQKKNNTKSCGKRGKGP